MNPPAPLAVELAQWAHSFRPDSGDLALAGRSLRDTVAVTLAARDHPVARLAAGLPEGARWAVTGHVLDFDDLHMQSTAHVSVVCVAGRAGHRRRRARVSRRGGRHGQARHRPGLAALLGGLAHDLQRRAHWAALPGPRSRSA